MKHLTKTDLVLIATNWEQLSENTKEKNDHISTCDHCQKQLAEVSQILNSFQVENEGHCNKYFDLLIKNLKRNKPPRLSQDLLSHLDDCEICKQIYNFASVVSPVDYALDLDIKIPQHFLKQLDMKVYAELEKLDFSNYLTQKVDNLLNSAEKTMHILRLFLFPTPKLSGIRGKDAPEYFIFTHKGGKIQLQIGLAEKDVKLFGIFEDKIFSNKSDIKGNVFFEDLPKDDYRVEVKGFAVSSIKTIS